MKLMIFILVMVASCTAATAAGPTSSDVLQSVQELAATIRSLKKIGYPEPMKADVGERPVSVEELSCADVDCSYNIIVKSKAGRRAVHRQSVHFCQNPDNIWVQCVS